MDAKTRNNNAHKVHQQTTFAEEKPFVTNCSSCRRFEDQSIFANKMRNENKWLEMSNPTYEQNCTAIARPRTKKHTIYCQEETKRNAEQNEEQEAAKAEKNPLQKPVYARIVARST